MTFATYPSLDGASVYITGGASGIGAEIVKAFANQHSKIGFIDFDQTNGEKLTNELRSNGVDIHFEFCDLRDIEASRAAFKKLEDALGPARVLVNNAARDDRHQWQDVTPEYYDCLLYTSPSPRDRTRSRMPSSA